MQVPSFAGLTSGTQRVFARFPETMLAAVAAAILALLSIRNSPHIGLPAAWAATGLGISACFSVTMLSEGIARSATPRFTRLRLVLGVLVAGGLIALAVMWPGWSDSVRAHRLIHFALASHLLAAFAPFTLHHRPNAFWQYNRALFTRFLVGGVYSAVLFGGLAVALRASKPLFGIHVSERIFVDLWLVIAFVFNTGYFLAGVPEDFDALESDTSYPGGLKVFAQFVLVPLVALYVVILTAYLVKVLVTGEWPNGWIGWLVSSVSAAGLLAILLVHPVRDRDENRWVSRFSRIFYLALLPSIGMLFAAIGKRIGQYGFTEERYYLLALALWITGISLGYSFRRRADIRWIPIALFVLAAVTAFGPGGAYTVSRIDQTARLQRLLSKHGLLAQGHIQPADTTLGFAEQKSLSAIIEYLAGTHGIRALPTPLRQAAERDSAYRASVPASGGEDRRGGTLVAQAVMRGLGLGYVSKWQSDEASNLNFFVPPRTGAVESISGYDYEVSLAGGLPLDVAITGHRVRLELQRTRLELLLTEDGAQTRTFALDSLLNSLKRRQLAPASVALSEPIRLQPAGDGLAACLVITQLTAHMSADTLAYLSLNGSLLLRGWGER